LDCGWEIATPSTPEAHALDVSPGATEVSIDAVVIAGGEKDGFRIVRQTSGEKVTYLVEMPDGCDALGVERWKDVSAEGKVVKTMRDFIIRQSLKSQE
jgi:phage/plasmid primase-like uncharacterized protein